MYSVTKWMLVAVLVGVSTAASARPLDVDSSWRPNLKGPAANGMHTPRGAVSKERDASFHGVDDRDGAPGSVGDKKGVDNFNHGRFACGEVVSGYTVTCA